jgi:hypothetical protein
MSGAAMGENCVIAAGQDRRHPGFPPIVPADADRIDPLMYLQQPTGLQPLADQRAADAGREQLAPRHDAVLSFRDRAYLLSSESARRASRPPCARHDHITPWSHGVE